MELWELLLILLVGIQALTVIKGHPSVTESDSPSEKTHLEADQFLTSYGYYPSSGPPHAQMQNPSLRNHSDTERTEALKLFQKFYNLPQSGKLDKETTQLMQKTRCGNADITPNPSTMGTRAGLKVEIEADVSLARKESKNQGSEESGVNVGGEKRSLDMSKQTRVKRMSTPMEHGKLDRFREHIMIWKIIDYSKQKSLQPINFQRDLVRKAMSVWEPLLPFGLEESFRYKPTFMEINFHSFSHSDQNDPDLHPNDCGWRKHGETDLEAQELVTKEEIWHRRFERRDEVEKQLKRKWNREELAKHNSARRINKTKIERPKNAPKRKGSHAHAMTTLNKDTPCPRDIHFDEDYDWSNHEELFSVLLHEIGHAWGLGHSSDERAVMYPYNRDVTQLAVSDIEGIQKLYGSQDGRLRRHLCEARLREVDQIFWNPAYRKTNSDWIGWYFVISGKKLQYLSVAPGGNKRIFRTYRLYEMIFHNAPSKYDVVFPHIGASSVFFIAGKTVYEYFKYTPMQVRNYSQEYFPETPKLSLAVLHEGRESIHLFGEKYQWSFEFTYDIQGPRTTIVLDDQARQRVKNSKFAVQWIDGHIYVVTRNGSWYSYDKSEKNRTELKPGYPPWMETYLCPDDAAFIGMSRPSLVLVIMLSLIKLY